MFEFEVVGGSGSGYSMAVGGGGAVLGGGGGGSVGECSKQAMGVFWIACLLRQLCGRCSRGARCVGGSPVATQQA